MALVTDPIAADIANKLQRNSLIRFTEIDQDGSRTPREQFIFRLNPSKVDCVTDKIEGYQLTKAGYDYQFWQNDLFLLSFSGTTGALVPDASSPVLIGTFGSRPQFDIRSTKAWADFERFYFDFYLQIGQFPIRMDFFGFRFQLIGSLKGFKFGLDALNGYISYSFSFTGLPRKYTPIATEISDFNDAVSEHIAPEIQTPQFTPGPLKPAFSQAFQAPVFPSTAPGSVGSGLAGRREFDNQVTAENLGE